MQVVCGAFAYGIWARRFCMQSRDRLVNEPELVPKVAVVWGKVRERVSPSQSISACLLFHPASQQRALVTDSYWPGHPCTLLRKVKLCRS